MKINEPKVQVREKIDKQFSCEFYNIEKSEDLVNDVTIREYLQNTNSKLEDYFIVKGIASTDSMDTDNEIIEISAWTEAVKVGGYRYKAFYNHNVYSEFPIGNVFITKIDTNGLHVCYLLPKADKTVSDRIYPQLKAKSIEAMSVGGWSTDSIYDEEKGCRRIKKMELREISLVVFPANCDAKIEAVKGVNPLKSYAIAEEGTVWDGSAAEKRWRVYSKSEDAPSTDYKNGFMWYDVANKDKFGAYKFNFVDIIDGEVKIVPKAIYTARSYANRSYNKLIMPEEDLVKLKALISKYYKLMGLDAPEFKSYKSIEEYYSDNLKTITDIEEELKFNNFSNKESKVFISKFKSIIESEKSKRDDLDGNKGSDFPNDNIIEEKVLHELCEHFISKNKK